MIEDSVEGVIAQHVSRAAAILLCTLTELQAHFKFDGARINERLHQVWNALLRVPEIKELYDERYAQLMRDKGINPLVGTAPAWPIRRSSDVKKGRRIAAPTS